MRLYNASSATPLGVTPANSTRTKAPKNFLPEQDHTYPRQQLNCLQRPIAFQIKATVGNEYRLPCQSPLPKFYPKTSNQSTGTTQNDTVSTSTTSGALESWTTRRYCSDDFHFDIDEIEETSFPPPPPSHRATPKRPPKQSAATTMRMISDVTLSSRSTSSTISSHNAPFLFTTNDKYDCDDDDDDDDDVDDDDCDEERSQTSPDPRRRGYPKGTGYHHYHPDEQESQRDPATESHHSNHPYQKLSPGVKESSSAAATAWDSSSFFAVNDDGDDEWWCDGNSSAVSPQWKVCQYPISTNSHKASDTISNTSNLGWLGWNSSNTKKHSTQGGGAAADLLPKPCKVKYFHYMAQHLDDPTFWQPSVPLKSQQGHQKPEHHYSDNQPPKQQQLPTEHISLFPTPTIEAEDSSTSSSSSTSSGGSSSGLNDEDNERPDKNASIRRLSKKGSWESYFERMDLDWCTIQQPERQKPHPGANAFQDHAPREDKESSSYRPASASAPAPVVAGEDRDDHDCRDLFDPDHNQWNTTVLPRSSNSKKLVLSTQRFGPDMRKQHYRKIGVLQQNHKKNGAATTMSYNVSNDKSSSTFSLNHHLCTSITTTTTNNNNKNDEDDKNKNNKHLVHQIRQRRVPVLLGHILEEKYQKACQRQRELQLKNTIKATHTTKTSSTTTRTTNRTTRSTTITTTTIDEVGFPILSHHHRHHHRQQETSSMLLLVNSISSNGSSSSSSTCSNGSDSTPTNATPNGAISMKEVGLFEELDPYMATKFVRNTNGQWTEVVEVE